MKITSSKFKQGEPIPKLHTCEGFDWNPPVEFHDVPKEAKSLVLMLEDYDVPKDLRPDGLWVHWIVYEIKPDCPGIPEHSAPPGTHGRGTNGRTAYMGPCPPDREHRYFFKLFAIDFMPDWPKGLDRDEVLKKIEGHIVEKAELMGTYVLEKKPE